MCLCETIFCAYLKASFQWNKYNIGVSFGSDEMSEMPCCICFLNVDNYWNVQQYIDVASENNV